MPPNPSDHLLWLAFGVFICVAAKGIQRAIRDTVQLTEIEKPADSDRRRTGEEQIEDSIPVETLRTLATSPNANIKNSAVSLIVSRFTSLPNAVQILVEDAQSLNEDKRRKAQTAMKFLRDWDSPSGLNGFEVPDTPSVGGGDMTEEVSHDTEEVQHDGPLPAWRRPLRRRGAMDLAARVLPSLNPLPSDEGADQAVEYRRQMEVRRRRREAMVLHEGEGEVGAGDIIPAV